MESHWHSSLKAKAPLSKVESRMMPRVRLLPSCRALSQVDISSLSICETNHSKLCSGFQRFLYQVWKQRKVREEEDGTTIVKIDIW